MADFAESCKIDKELVSRLLVGLADKVLQQLADQGSGIMQINQLKQQPFITADDLEYFKGLSDNIVARTAYLKAQVAQIPSIRGWLSDSAKVFEPPASATLYANRRRPIKAKAFIMERSMLNCARESLMVK